MHSIFSYKGKYVCFFHNAQSVFVLNLSHTDANTDKPIKKFAENEQIKALGMNQK